MARSNRHTASHRRLVAQDRPVSTEQQAYEARRAEAFRAWMAQVREAGR